MYDLERLHPAAVIENLIRNIYKFFQILIGPLVIIATSPLSKRWLVIIAIVGLGAYFLISILSWYRFRYAVYNEELRIEYGILARRKTYIPIERIQSMQITTGIVQRIFGQKLMYKLQGVVVRQKLPCPPLLKNKPQNFKPSLI